MRSRQTLWAMIRHPRKSLFPLAFVIFFGLFLALSQVKRDPRVHAWVQVGKVIRYDKEKNRPVLAEVEAPKETYDQFKISAPEVLTATASPRLVFVTRDTARSYTELFFFTKYPERGIRDIGIIVDAILKDHSGKIAKARADAKAESETLRRQWSELKAAAEHEPNLLLSAQQKEAELLAFEKMRAETEASGSRILLPPAIEYDPDKLRWPVLLIVCLGSSLVLSLFIAAFAQGIIRIRSSAR